MSVVSDVNAPFGERVPGGGRAETRLRDVSARDTAMRSVGQDDVEAAMAQVHLAVARLESALAGQRRAREAMLRELHYGIGQGDGDCDTTDDVALARGCDSDSVSGLLAIERVAAAIEARRFELVLTAVGRQAEHLSAKLPDDPDRDCRISDVRAIELAAALNISPNRARTLAWQARTMVVQLPRAHRELAAGRLEPYRARLIMDGWRDVESRWAATGQDVPDAAADVFQERVLLRVDRAMPDFRRAIKLAVSMLAPQGQAAVHEAARAQRHVTVTPAGDGMAWLTAYLEVAQAARVMQALEHSARCDTSLVGTQGQRTADALVAIVTGASEVSPTARAAAAELQLVVSAQALAAGHLSAIVNGTDLVIEGSALDALLRNARFRRLLCDAAGRLIDYGRTTYRPPTDLADHVRGRDRTCRAPGCARAARYADLDHTIPWQDGGTTDEANVATLCRTHHVLKTHGHWRYQTAADGTTYWQTPSGMIIGRPPADYREFDPVAAGGPPQVTTANDPPPF